jgi:hypothetical protein
VCAHPIETTQNAMTLAVSLADLTSLAIDQSHDRMVQMSQFLVEHLSDPESVKHLISLGSRGAIDAIQNLANKPITTTIATSLGQAYATGPFGLMVTFFMTVGLSKSFDFLIDWIGVGEAKRWYVDKLRFWLREISAIATGQFHFGPLLARLLISATPTLRPRSRQALTGPVPAP